MIKASNKNDPQSLSSAFNNKMQLGEEAAMNRGKVKVSSAETERGEGGINLAQMNTKKTSTLANAGSNVLEDAGKMP